MGDPTMALGPEDLKRIVDYAKPWLRDAVLEIAGQRPREVDTQLLERMVRVEEELRTQRELMDERFTAMDKRFDDMLAASDRRFADMDKRFTDMRSYSDKRFAGLQWTLVVGFTIVTVLVTVFGLLA